MHVSLVLLVGQLLVLAQGAFAIATGVNLLRGAQTLGDVSAGFRPLQLSHGAVTSVAIAGIAVGAFFITAGLRVRRLSLLGRVPIALAELVLLLISSIAIAVGGENLSVISVAVLAFAGSPILPGAAVLGVQVVVIYALLIHPGIDVVRTRRQAAAPRPPLRVHLPAQPGQSPRVSGAPAPRYAGPPGRAQLSRQRSVTAARAGASAPPGASTPPSPAPAAPPPTEPNLRVMPTVSPRLVIPARDAVDAPAAALDLRIAAARPAPAAPPPQDALPPAPEASAAPAPALPALPEPPDRDAPAAEPPAPEAPPAALTPVERVRALQKANAQPVPPAPPPSAPAIGLASPAPAKSEPALFVGLRPGARKPASKRSANQQLLRPARGAGAELRDVRLKPGVHPRVLPPPDDDELVDEE